VKIEDLDWKKPLDLDQKATKTRAQNALILPEKVYRRPRALSDMRANRLGPGLYNLIFDLVETRKDKGVVSYKLTPFNDREVQMDLAQKDIFDGELDPNYNYNKPRKPEFMYHEPIEWNPPHPSDGMLFRERWRFYDGDVNKVRPEIKAIDFAKNLNMKEFLQFEYEFKLLEDYLQRRKKVPEIGHYKVDYKQIDKNVPVPDLEKLKDREEKEEKQTDELILNPQKPQPKILTLNFEKQVFSAGFIILQLIYLHVYRWEEKQKILMKKNCYCLIQLIINWIRKYQVLWISPNFWKEKKKIKLKPKSLFSILFIIMSILKSKEMLILVRLSLEKMILSIKSTFVQRNASLIPKKILLSHILQISSKWIKVVKGL